MLRGLLRALSVSLFLMGGALCLVPADVFAACCGGGGANCCGRCCSASPTGCQAGACPI